VNFSHVPKFEILEHDNPPLSEDLGMILFLFFSSASATTFIVLALIDDSTRQVIVGQVGEWNQVILQLDGKPIVEEVGFLLVRVHVV
jgi:hypothetical protein